MPLQPQPYRLNVHDDVLDDLLERLTRTRWPDEILESGWQYGSSLAFMRRLTERWARSLAHVDALDLPAGDRAQVLSANARELFSFVT